MENLPAELKAGRRFAIWRYVLRNGKWSKPPRNPLSGRAASSTDPNTWATFSAALRSYRQGDWDGVGIMLRPDAADPDDLVGIDCDHCFDPGIPAITDEKVADIVASISTYTELSPSGHGIRIIGRGAKPAGACRRGNIEMYSHGRFLTLTGHHLAGTATKVAPVPEAIAIMWRRYLVGRPAVARGPADALLATAQSPALTDDQVIERAVNARNGSKVLALLDGDLTNHDHDHSTADLALMSALAFWTQDPEQLDRLMRGSRLMRDKWNSRRGETTYGSITIGKALSGVTERWLGAESTRGEGSQFRL